jgi:L-alanine-DL-glutamate epimerase-like enolase superfamily enzyme
MLPELEGSDDEDRNAEILREAAGQAQRTAAMARAALIIACMALAAAILGIFLPL